MTRRNARWPLIHFPLCSLRHGHSPPLGKLIAVFQCCNNDFRCVLRVIGSIERILDWYYISSYQMECMMLCHGSARVLYPICLILLPSHHDPSVSFCRGACVRACLRVRVCVCVLAACVEMPLCHRCCKFSVKWSPQLFTMNWPQLFLLKWCCCLVVACL